MKIRYFGHYLKDTSSGACISFDMRQFLLNFVKFDHPQFKTNFSYNGENLYLFDCEQKDIFLFVETRNTDFFKKINKENLTLSDLKQMIDGESELGYASYIVFGKDHFGICSTFMAPGAPAFCGFVNDVFRSLGITNLDFRAEPLLQEAQAADVMKLNVVGRTSLELSRSNKFAQDICNVFGADISNDLTLDSVEIIFKPKRKANIKPIASKIMTETSDLPDATMKVRAKEFVKDTLTDFYLGENGHLFDEINYKTESDIPKMMASAIARNKYIANKVSELVKNAKIKDDSSIIIYNYNTEPAWSSLLANLPQPIEA